VSRQRVADGDLGDASARIAITLQVIDRRVIDSRLDHVPLTRVVSIRQLPAHLDERYAALVAEYQREALEIPAIHLRVRRPLLDKLDERGANPRRLHSG